MDFFQFISRHYINYRESAREQRERETESVSEDNNNEKKKKKSRQSRTHGEHAVFYDDTDEDFFKDVE